ncbi:hypothetical protein D7X33_09045 [Butyricicoccus sp. 1XD8-22]|nr:hypothetical protein D7X33_09045 [Butyricicoccus sp. 1XD8-22]
METRSYADSGRALPCTRDFFVKKSSKNFFPPAGGITAPNGSAFPRTTLFYHILTEKASLFAQEFVNFLHP